MEKLKSKKNNKLLLIVIAALVVITGIVIAIIVSRSVGEQRFQSKLSLGNKYLEEMKYEEALAEFTAALNINPASADAYIGIVEVYIRTCEFDTALDWAKKGYEATSDERLADLINMIENGDIYSSNGLQMRMSYYDGNGTLVYYHTYTYLLDGRKGSVTWYSGNGIKQGYIDLTPTDEQGHPQYSYSWITDTGELHKSEHIYEDNIEIRYDYNTDDIPIDKHVSHLDEYGRWISAEYYHLDSSDNYVLIRTSICEYNDAGRQTHIESIDVEGDKKETINYEYDDQGRMTKSQIINVKDGETNILESIATFDGKYRHGKSYRNGELVRSVECEYEDETQEKLLVEKEYDAEGNLMDEIRY